MRTHVIANPLTKIENTLYNVVKTNEYRVLSYSCYLRQLIETKKSDIIVQVNMIHFNE